MTELKARLRAMAVECLGVEPDKIADDTLLFTDHGDRANPGGIGDSLDRTDFAMMVEDAFDLDIPDADDKGACATINSMAAYLEKRGVVAGSAGAA